VCFYIFCMFLFLSSMKPFQCSSYLILHLSFSCISPSLSADSIVHAASISRRRLKHLFISKTFNSFQFILYSLVEEAELVMCDGEMNIHRRGERCLVYPKMPPAAYQPIAASRGAGHSTCGP